MRIVILNDGNSDFARRGSIPKHVLSQSGGVTLGDKGPHWGTRGHIGGTRGKGGKGEGVYLGRGKVTINRKNVPDHFRHHIRQFGPFSGAKSI